MVEIIIIESDIADTELCDLISAVNYGLGRNATSQRSVI